MPIFARTKMVIQDDCWNVAGPEMKLHYSGLNPHLAYQKIREMFWTVFGVKEAERVQEKEYVWDKKGKKETFKVAWEITKDMDKFSYLYIRVKMNGFAEETEGGKIGELDVEIDGFLRTEYPQDTIWERNIFYEMARVFWHRVFYQEKRWEYLDVCRSLMMKFRNELKSFFNLLPKG